MACACLDTRLSLRSSRQAHDSKQKHFTKSIKLYNDKIEITFNTPTLQSPNDKGSFLMLKNKMKKMIQNKSQPALIDMSVEFYV